MVKLRVTALRTKGHLLRKIQEKKERKKASHRIKNELTGKGMERRRSNMMT